MTRHDWLHLYKPAASARTHLLAAACMWSAVGLGLASFGIRWSVQSHSRLVALFMAVAVAVGILKANLVLDRTAERAVTRIRSRGNGHCLGGFFSGESWLFVLSMMVAGRILRATLPTPLVGLIYLGVGTALSLVSRRFWAAWRNCDAPDAAR